MLGKGVVNGVNMGILYRYLKQESPESEIDMNFYKYLLDSEGKFVKFYHYDVNPRNMMVDIEPLLEQQ